MKLTAPRMLNGTRASNVEHCATALVRLVVGQTACAAVKASVVMVASD